MDQVVARVLGVNRVRVFYSPEHRAAVVKMMVWLLRMGMMGVGVGMAAGSGAGSAAVVFVVVAAALVALHVAADAEGFATAGVRALERLLARVRVAVDSQRARARERLVARLAHVSVLRLRERRCRRRRDVVVVLPWIRSCPRC